MAENYHIANIKGDLPDIQKSCLWTVEIEVPTGMSDTFGIVPGKLDSKTLRIRAKSAKIPNRTINNIETKFMGMVSNYAGTEDMGNKTLEIGFYEYEDQKISKSINMWINTIFDSMSNTASGGHGSVKQKINGYATKISVYETGLNGDKLDKKAVFHAAWPKDLSEVSLNYDGSSAIEYNVTFQYDYWTLEQA